MKNFERITLDPAQMGGVLWLRHLRIPMTTVLRLLAGERSEREILSESPDLQTWGHVAAHVRAYTMREFLVATSQVGVNSLNSLLYVLFVGSCAASAST